MSKPDTSPEALRAVANSPSWMWVVGNIKALLWAVADEKEKSEKCIQTSDVKKKEASMWQPAETAPEDGSGFLAFDAYGFLTFNAYGMEVVSYIDDAFLTHDGRGFRFTHWMPLPEVPKS